MENTKEKKIIEEMVFDDYEYAKNEMEKLEKSKSKKNIALIVAGIVSLLSLFWIGNQSGVMLIIILVGAGVSYFLGGGFETASSWALKIAKFGWFVVPFPFDLISGLVCLIIAVFGFFLFPILFVGLNYIQNKKNLKSAKEYLKYYKNK